MDIASLIVGGFSTAISALALIGVAIALRLQVRQARISQHQTSSTMLLELMRLHMEYPDYRKIWGEATAPREPEAESADATVTPTTSG